MNISKLLEDKKSLAKGLFALGTASFLVSVAFFTNSTQASHLAGYGYGYGATNPTTVLRTGVARFWNVTVGDHFYTATVPEKNTAPAGYVAEGTGFNGWDVLGSNATGSQRLYRSFNKVTGDHFYTREEVEYQHAVFELGYRPEGTTVWVYENVDDAASNVFVTPVHRLWNGTISDHFYTRSAAEKDTATGLGYSYEGIGFYTPEDKVTP